jgi:hypothetical protein
MRLWTLPTCVVFPGPIRCAARDTVRTTRHAFWSLSGRRLAGVDGRDPDGALGPVTRPGEPMRRPPVSTSQSCHDLTQA